MNRTTLMILALAWAATGHAQDEENNTGWTGNVGFGFAATTGNTETKTSNARLALSYRLDKWEHGAAVSALVASTNDGTQAERYNAGWQSRYSFTDKDYAFGLLFWEKDRFSGVNQQFSQTVGYGRRVLDNDTHKLNLEVGVGTKQSDLQDGTSNDEAIVRLAGDYAWTISETASFTQTLATEIGSNNTYIESVTGVTARLVSNIDLVLAYTIKNNSDVPAGSEKTDTFTTINLQYSF